MEGFAEGLVDGLIDTVSGMMNLPIVVVGLVMLWRLP